MRCGFVVAFLVIAIIASCNRARAAEQWMPQTKMPMFLGKSWCHDRSIASPGLRHFKIEPGCKSLAAERNVLTLNGSICKITSIAKSAPEFGNVWWLRGHCTEKDATQYLGDFRFYEATEDGVGILIMLLPPYFPLLPVLR
jgi:hypothetical protein